MLRHSVTNALAILVLALPLAYGQSNNGRIEGTVQDPTGALVPGVQMTATNLRTQLKVEGLSGEQGQYVLTALPPGIYRLTAELKGFRKADIEPIEVNVGATVAQNIKLDLGSIEETVSVEARTLSVQTNTGDVSFSRVNGLRTSSNNAKLDGIDINDSVVPRLGLSLTANNTDSIGEFRVVLGGGKAEYGRSAGAQVELVTRSGTNQFHGNAFDYLRNTVL